MQCATTNRLLPHLLIGALFFLTALSSSAASKTDIVIFKNGDKLTGEVWNKRWFTNGSLAFDQNDELGLNLRTSIGAGGGRYLVQSNTMLFSLEGGLQFSRENLIAEDEDTDSLEATISAYWDWFLFEDPELDWSTRLQIIPSLTEQGRVRGELDTTLSWEIVGGLKWAFSLYGSFDNQPQSGLEQQPIMASIRRWPTILTSCNNCQEYALISDGLMQDQ